MTNLTALRDRVAGLRHAAGVAFTALSFAEETYRNAGDGVALAQTTAAKNALIEALSAPRPMRDITPADLQALSQPKESAS
jgi:hypothetical protein